MDQQSKFDIVRQRLRRDWRNDNAVLSQYFIACTENWKVYKGERSSKQVARLNAIYRQATVGDSPWVRSQESSKREIEREFEWYRLKGMPQDMAKRRYITFLAEIDPLLIDVMPSEKPPLGFPTDKKGRTICAKCNTAVGCQRPILDMRKAQLRMQLLENEKLHDAPKVSAFVDEAMKGHQCMWGIHTYIHRADAKPFMEWFNMPENQGFQPYDYSPVFDIVKDLVIYHYELAWDMQQHKAEYSVDDMNAQLIRTKELKEYYEQLSGTEFFFNIPCTRDNDICNKRRQGDNGANHSHPVELDEPSFRKPTFEDLIQLRQQCISLGIKPQIGVESDIGKRCKIYQQRILEHFERLQKAAEAKTKNEARAMVHKKEKADIKRTSTEMSKLQVSEAANTLSLSQIDNLIKKGCDLNTESARGQTPLIAMALCGAPTEMFVRAIRAGAEVEYCNKFGFTALMVACRRRDAAVIHAILKNGASAMTADPVRKQSAVHLCAFFGLETEAQILYDYVKEGAGDSLKVINFLNAKDKEGETALIIAARRRNGLMCKFLLSLGADPGSRNLSGRTAATVARDAGWVDLAEWLGTKVGGGIKKVETVTDTQMERRLRFGMMSTRDKIRDFVQQYITLLYGSSFAQHVNTCPLGTPAWVHELKHEKISLKDQFQRLAEAQYTYIYAPVAEHRYRSIKEAKAEKDNMSGARSPAKATAKSMTRSVTSLNKINWASEVVELRLLCREMLATIQKGDAAPDTEGSKPRPWTVMMCAAAINDTDTMKRLLREGSDVNAGNKSGTTPLMLAAQLNVVDSVAFLLQNGANLDQVDMHGYPAIAYATTLPMPEELHESICSYMSDGDTSFTKRLNAEKLLKMAAIYGTQGLNSVLDDNVISTGEDEKAEWDRYHSLLESHGLSKMETSWQLQNSIKNAGKRLCCDVNEEFASNLVEDSESETESEIADKEAYMAMLEQKRIEREKQAELDSLRCPICTLLTPCPHFLNPNTLKKLIDGGYKPPPKVSIIRDGSILTKKQIAFLTERVLRESGLNDRQTDRTVHKLRQYQKRIVQLNREKSALMIEAAENATSAANEAEATLVIEDSQRKERRGALTTLAIAQDLVTQEWRQEIDAYGRITFIHKHTNEAWSMHISVQDGDAKAYYYNATTNQTQWEPPGSLSGLSLDVLSKTFEVTPLEAVSDNDTANMSIVPAERIPPETEGKSKMKKKKKGVVKFALEEDEKTTDEVTIVADIPNDMNETKESNDAPNSSVPAVEIHGEIVDNKLASGPLISALKTGEKSSEKKKKKRVGGIRFTNDGENGEVTVEVRTIESVDQSSVEEVKKIDAQTKTSATDLAVIAESGDPKIPDTKELVKSPDTNASASIDDRTEESLAIVVTPVMTSEKSVDDRTEESLAIVVTPVMTSEKSVDSDGPAQGSSEQECISTELGDTSELVRPPAQPLPPKERKIFTFTKNTSLGVTVVDGIMPTELTNSCRDANRSEAKFPDKHTPATVEYPVFVSGWMFSGIAVPISHPNVISREDSDVFASFRDSGEFSLTKYHNERKKISADMQVAPVEGVNVSMESWGVALEYVRGVLLTQFLPVLEFHCVVNPKDWRISNQRCPLCRLGIIRYNIDASDHEDSRKLSTLLTNYCVTCAVRGILYNKIRKCTPRSQKSRLSKDWPVYVPPEHYPLERGEVLPIHRALSAENLDLLESALETKEPTNQKIDKYDVSALMSPKNQSQRISRTLSPLGRSTSPLQRSGSKTPERALSPAHRVVKKMMTREHDSDDEDDKSTMRSPSGAKAKFLSKTTGGSPKKSQTALHSKSMSSMPAFMRNFSASGLVQDNVYEVAEAIPEPVPDMNLETRYGPQELALVPFLIAKGQYDEVERLLRVTMCLEDILGEAGAVHTVQVLFLQADMYMLLDLFPLAFGLYLDSVDILASSLGMDDARFVEGVYKLLCCARKMGIPPGYLSDYTVSMSELLQSSMISAKQAMVDDIDKMEMRSESNQALVEEVFVVLREYDAKLHSNSEYRRMISSIRGLVSFVNVLESPNGLASAARVMFVHYCCTAALPEGKSRAQTVGPIAQFVAACCKIRQCQDPEVYRFLIQNLLQKYLSKHENIIESSLPDSESIVRNVRTFVTEKLEKKGKPPGIQEFDSLFLKCVLYLYEIYPAFLRSSVEIKKLVVDDFLEAEAEYAYVSAVTIQTFWRQKYMKWQVARRRSNRNILRTLELSGTFVLEEQPEE